MHEGPRGRSFHGTVCKMNDPAEISEFVVCTPTDKYWEDPTSAVGQDNSKLHFHTPQEIRKGVKVAICHAKRLMVKLNSEKSVGGDSDEEIRPQLLPNQRLRDSGSSTRARASTSSAGAPCRGWMQRELEPRASSRPCRQQTALFEKIPHIELPVGKINKSVDAVVLDGCPTVLSLGQG